mmetsp:Transcript_39738/g.93064  ORF Transcript_39738/g.93064 Transcript_39738/m.93064 type:complete len:1153 (-) Transcript_39738:1378-4836(-)
MQSSRRKINKEARIATVTVEDPETLEIGAKVNTIRCVDRVAIALCYSLCLLKLNVKCAAYAQKESKSVVNFRGSVRHSLWQNDGIMRHLSVTGKSTSMTESSLDEGSNLGSEDHKKDDASLGKDESFLEGTICDEWEVPRKCFNDVNDLPNLPRWERGQFICAGQYQFGLDQYGEMSLWLVTRRKCARLWFGQTDGRNRYATWDRILGVLKVWSNETLPLEEKDDILIWESSESKILEQPSMTAGDTDIAVASLELSVDGVVSIVHHNEEYWVISPPFQLLKDIEGNSTQSLSKYETMCTGKSPFEYGILKIGQFICTRSYQFGLSPAGELTLWKNDDSNQAGGKSLLWSTGISGVNNVAEFRVDGNLLVHQRDPVSEKIIPLWSSNTMKANSKHFELILDENDGSVKILSRTPTSSPSVEWELQQTACTDATKAPSGPYHVFPSNETPVSKIGFSSCYTPSSQSGPQLWQHVKNDFTPDLWLWLGDNAYSDGRDMEYKRRKYHDARDDLHYSKYGPIAMGIPVTGTWDDHDWGSNNKGGDYECGIKSQNEFVIHFNIPDSDPRHPNQGSSQQQGIYSANMFKIPNSSTNGIHVINLDARFFRSRTYKPCDGDAPDFLGEEQWAWLEEELQQTAEVLVITSGIPVLPPTNQYNGATSEYCSYDGPGNSSFDDSIKKIGESSAWKAGDDDEKETWGEIPQARSRLLRLVQKYVNMGHAKQVIFVSGNQHWGEIMAKKMPANTDVGSARIFYEVVASGIDRSRDYSWPNSNRVRLRSADTQGNALYHNECKFPFTYQGNTYDDCTTDNHPGGRNDGQIWCAITTDPLFWSKGLWGFCLHEDEELVPRSKQNVAGLTCANDYHHTCNVQAVYGGISVDWKLETLKLNVFKKVSNYVSLSSSIEIDINALPQTKAPSSNLVPSSQPTPSNLCEDDLLYLSTGTSSDDDDWGVMFDVRATANDADISIYGLDIHLDKNMDNSITIYTRFGSHLGHEKSYSGWTHLGTYSVITNGLGALTTFDFEGKVIKIASGKTQAFYVAQLNNDDVRYLDAGSIVSDSNIDIGVATVMDGNEVPFSGSPKHGVGFSGGIRYKRCTASTLSPTRSTAPTTQPTFGKCGDLSTGFEGTDEDNEGEGIMFDIVVNNKSDIEIDGFLSI